MKKEVQGMWVAIDGVDAVGKSTQVSLVADGLREVGINPTIVVPEFSSSPVGQVIQEILVRQRFYALAEDRETPLADTLHLLTDMAFNYEKLIGPTIHRGGIAVSDRGSASLIAYQAIRLGERSQYIEKGMAYEWSRTLATHCFMIPDLTILIKIPESEMIRRIISRGESPPNEKELEFLHEVDLLLAQAAGQVSREVVTIDGDRSLKDVTDQMISFCLQRWQEHQDTITNT